MLCAVEGSKLFLPYVASNEELGNCCLGCQCVEFSWTLKTEFLWYSRLTAGSGPEVVWGLFIILLCLRFCRNIIHSSGHSFAIHVTSLSAPLFDVCDKPNHKNQMQNGLVYPSGQREQSAAQWQDTACHIPLCKMYKAQTCSAWKHMHTTLGALRLED